MEKLGYKYVVKQDLLNQNAFLLCLSNIGVSNKNSSYVISFKKTVRAKFAVNKTKKAFQFHRLTTTKRLPNYYWQSKNELKRPQNHTVIKYKLYLSRSPLETERWWSVPESPPSDNDPSSSGSTDPALGLLRDLREPPLSIWDAKDGTLFLRWRLPIELCSDTARFA